MPRISHSTIETWQTCQMRWSLKQLAKAPEAPVQKFFLGNVIHATIEADNRQRIAGHPPLALEDLLLQGEQCLAEKLAEGDPDGLLGPKKHSLLNRTKAALRAYHSEVAPHFTPLTAEGGFGFDLADVDPAAPEDPWRFTGRTDGVMLDGDNAVVIVEYKTASSLWKVAREHENRQATAYLWAAQEQGYIAIREVVYPIITIWNEGTDAAVTVDIRRTTRSPEQIAAYRQLVRQTITELTEAQARADYLPSPGRICRDCSVAPSCMYRV
jgi:RecB family exonuclease